MLSVAAMIFQSQFVHDCFSFALTLERCLAVGRVRVVLQTYLLFCGIRSRTLEQQCR